MIKKKFTIAQREIVKFRIVYGILLYINTHNNESEDEPTNNITDQVIPITLYGYSQLQSSTEQWWLRGEALALYPNIKFNLHFFSKNVIKFGYAFGKFLKIKSRGQANSFVRTISPISLNNNSLLLCQRPEIFNVLQKMHSHRDGQIFKTLNYTYSSMNQPIISQQRRFRTIRYSKKYLLDITILGQTKLLINQIYSIYILIFLINICFLKIYFKFTNTYIKLIN